MKKATTRINIATLVTIAGTVLVLDGCAKNTREIPANYVSPQIYTSLSCEELKQEGARLRAQVSQLGGQVDQQASRDDMQMTVGMLLFWPSLFFLDGDSPQAHEYARISGENNAVQQAINSKCSA